MGDQSMRACLEEALLSFRASFPDGTEPQEWYDDDADVAVFTAPGANVGGLYSWGYIVGCADSIDMTVMDMLGGFGLSLDPPSRRPILNVEIFDPPFRSCPFCGAHAICMLPPRLTAKQPDGTNAVCHPAHGGCNHGFEYATGAPSSPQPSSKPRSKRSKKSEP